MKKAIAILTYNRPDYFELVLASILEQTIFGRPITDTYDLYVFQDGFLDETPETNRHGHAKIEGMLCKIPPHIKKFIQKSNLGVALHFDYIERFLFLEKKYDFVVFCEDDLILAPGYMQAMDLLGNKFHDDPRVGMVAAHPADPTITLQKQREKQEEYAPMGHNWGFGLSKSFWEKRQPFIDCYLEFVKNISYSKRPHQAIYKWLELAGFPPSASSQDFIKQCATVALGACRLSTFVNFGLPIGRTGLHCKPELFKKMGFDQTVIFDKPINRLAELNDIRFKQIYNEQAQQFGGNFTELSHQRPNEWQSKILSDELNPKRIMPEHFQSKESQTVEAPIWRQSDIPTRPHMEAEGIALLESHLKKCKIYLEYGAGGSTVLAAELGVPLIHSIDSDIGFLQAVQEKIKHTNPTANVEVHYVNIGPTKEWGQPVDASNARRWPKYCVAAWNTLRAQNQQPDLILIDGRFRVACFLASLMQAKPGTVILFDDYFDRPHYHVVENYLKPKSKAGRMAEFIVESEISYGRVIFDLLEKSTDPA